MVSNVLAAVVIFVICLVVINVVNRILDKLMEHNTRTSETVKRFLHTAVRVALWLIAIVIIAGALGIPTASLVAVISIAGLALSLSVQNILTNLFSGITLLFTRPFDVGDHIKVGDNEGIVMSIGLFYTTVRSVDKRLITIPNSNVASAAVTNFTREPLRRQSFVFGTEYSDSTGAAMQALKDAIAACPEILEDPAPNIFISSFEASCIQYTIHVWTKTEDYWTVYMKINELVRDAFDANGVHMSYEHLNVHIMKE